MEKTLHKNAKIEDEIIISLDRTLF